MQAPRPAVLLMRDKQGEEKISFYIGLSHRIVTHIVLRARGSLLTPIPEEKQIPQADGRATHNYQIMYYSDIETKSMYRDHTITLFCDEEDVSPLSDYDHLLLAGIQNPETRYHIFITPNKLEWGAQLKVDDRVLVSIPDPIAAKSGTTRKTSAMIQYVGPVESLPGLTFGVEILDPHHYGQGTTDGTYQDERYFTCRDGNGLFVSLDKLSVDPTGGSPPGGQRHIPNDGWKNGRRKPKAPPVAVSRTGLPSRFKASPVAVFSTGLPSRFKAPLEAVPSTGPPSRFKVGDRVVIFNKKGAGVHGTVKWTGEYGYQDEKKKYQFFCYRY